MLNTKLEAIADAIRYKRRSNNNYYLNEMPNEINNIGDRVQPYKVVEYSSSGTYTVTPDNGYDTLNSVVVGVQTSGQDTSNLVIWDSVSKTGFVGSNARDMSSAFKGKNFSSVADGLVLPNYTLNFYYAFSEATGVNLVFGSNTKFSNAAYTFYQTSFSNPETLQGFLDCIRNSEPLSLQWCVRQVSTSSSASSSYVLEIGNRLDNVTSIQYGMFGISSRFILNNVALNFKQPNVGLGTAFSTSNFTPNSIVSIRGSILSGPVFQQINCMSYLNAELYTNLPFNLAVTCNELFGAKIVCGWNWLNNTQFMMTNLLSGCRSLRSVDFKIHNRTSTYNYCSMPVFQWSFFNHMSLTDVWLDLSELDEFDPAGSSTAAHYCLHFNNTFRFSNNIERVFIDYPTYNNFFNIWFSNTFLTLVATKKHDIVLGGRNLYNRVLTANAAVFSGAMTFTEETVDDNIVFNFYNENNMVNYTKSVHVVRRAYNTTKNIYVYCTE